MAAELEARHYDADFSRDPFERQFLLEGHQLQTLADEDIMAGRLPAGRSKSNQRWSYALPPAAFPHAGYSAGRGYLEQWKIQSRFQGFSGFANPSEVSSSLPAAELTSDTTATESTAGDSSPVAQLEES